jgi:hypothetical protein
MLSEVFRKKPEPCTPPGTGRVVSGQLPMGLSLGTVQSGRLVSAKSGGNQSALRLRIRDLVRARPLRIWVLLCREGWLENRKRARRLYRL